MRISCPIALLFIAVMAATVSPAAADSRPNILWIVWDTVRADRLGIYGYDRPTTPFLDEWIREARVFDDCVSAANYTVASHASMFTGLLPTEHGAVNGRVWLADEHRTVAEFLRDAGYDTYLYAANPHISIGTNIARGFAVRVHPWDERHAQEALRIVEEKARAGGRRNDLTHVTGRKDEREWSLTPSGEIGILSIGGWLRDRSPEKPWFAFMNFMEAHLPRVPREDHRRLFVSDEDFDRAMQVDWTWERFWSYSFGLSEFPADYLDVFGDVYDATLRDLDRLFQGLMVTLERGGHLENTVVILTADHGEFLGEHHMLGHQYALYQPLVHIPLVVRRPGGIGAGRERRPVTNLDLFTTLLGMVGIEPPPGGAGVDLFTPDAERERLSECLGVFQPPLGHVGPRRPSWDDTPWRRELRALFEGQEKLIRFSDGAAELYRLPGDPGETKNLFNAAGPRSTAMGASLDAYLARLRPDTTGAEPPPLSDEERARLRALGYAE